MSEIPNIAKPRRKGANRGAVWDDDNTLNEQLGDLSPFAEFYVLRHKAGNLTVVSVFETTEALIERLQSTGCCGGDLVEIYAVTEQQREVRAKVPDLEGLAPMEFLGGADE